VPETVCWLDLTDPDHPIHMYFTTDLRQLENLECCIAACFPDWSVIIVCWWSAHSGK